jgi:ribosomal protein L40E
MPEDEIIFQCLICGRVSPVRAKPPKCGKCGSGNGVTRPKRDAVVSERQYEEEKKL